jgi:hypothetical protein
MGRRAAPGSVAEARSRGRRRRTAGWIERECHERPPILHPATVGARACHPAYGRRARIIDTGAACRSGNDLVAFLGGGGERKDPVQPTGVNESPRAIRDLGTMHNLARAEARGSASSREHARGIRGSGDMKTRVLMSWVVVGVVAVAVPTVARCGTLKVFVTTDPAEKDSQPSDDNPWDEVGEDNTVDITGVRPKYIWFACRNENNDGKFKSFQIKFSPVAGRLNPLNWMDATSVAGFTGGDDDNQVSTQSLNNDYNEEEGSVTFRYVFDGQPDWERVTFQFRDDFPPTKLKVRAWSHCSETSRKFEEFPALTVNDGGFGALEATIGDPRITEILVFPKQNPVDREAPWTFDAPPHTGNWEGSFVGTDPNGDARPLGGLRVVSDGEGLATGDLYDMSFGMVGNVDMRYDLFAYESTRDEYLDFILPAGQIGMLSNFDPFPIKEDVCGHGHWEVWEGGGDICGEFSDEQSFSPPQSLRVSGLEGPAGDDMVRLLDIVGGVWQFKSMVYVPADATGQAWFAFLNQYPRNKNWSLQIGFDADRNRVYNFNRPTQRLPLVKGQWTEIIVRIDLDRDVAEAWYQGQPFITNWSWRDGVSGNGQPWIQAVDVYGGEPNFGGISSIYFDNIEVTKVTFGSCCMGQTGECRDGITNLECAQVQGLFREETACAEWDPPCGETGGCVRDPEWVCMGDVDGNGRVNPVDVGLIQAAFCSQGQCPEQALCQYDIDCNDVINPVDAGIVQSLFGQCAPPNDPCR